jgi:protoheme ferro-lyase
MRTIFSAHSIPVQSIELGEPYIEEFDKTVRKLVERVKPKRWFKAYQSLGMLPIPWLKSTMEMVLE